MPSNYLILCLPLLLLPSIFPSFRVFSSESALRIRWPKYWSFSFSISPSSEYSGLISFRIDWFNLSVPFLSSVYISLGVKEREYLKQALCMSGIIFIVCLLTMNLFFLEYWKKKNGWTPTLSLLTSSSFMDSYHLALQLFHYVSVPQDLWKCYSFSMHWSFHLSFSEYIFLSFNY